LPERVGTAVTEALGLVDGEPELTVQRAGRSQRQRFAQVPEQLMELPHDREYPEHLRCERGRPAPVLPGEGDLGDLLPGAEAVVGGAAGEALLPEVIVNAAAEVRPQVRTCLPGVLVDGEVSGGREGRRDTAQCEAAGAVRSQARAIPIRAGFWQRGHRRIAGHDSRVISQRPAQRGTASAKE